MRETDIYDAIIVGSGASGGWAAKELTEQGMKVIVLESGRDLNPLADFHTHTWPYELKFRNKFDNTWLQRERQPVQSKVFGCDEYSHQFFIDDIDNPYTTPAEKPYAWIRGAVVGGRTNVWGRQVYRMSDYELKAASRDGYGEDWPISYKDLAPYYDRVEEFIGVSGALDGLPQLPDGKFLPPMKMTCGELLLKRAVEKRWNDRRVIMGRSATLTRHLNGRAKCHYAGSCYRGCSTMSFFSSPGSTLPAAAATGRLTLRSNSIASHVVVDKKSGKAKGVAFVDCTTNKAYEVLGKVIVLAASTIASTRILLNSATNQHPAGLGNSSGLLGHYLHGHVHSVWVTGVVPSLSNYPNNLEDRRPNQIYIPRFRNLTERHPDFIRGFGVEGAVKRKMLPTTMKSIPGFGSEFKRLVREAKDPAPFWLTAFGEMLPRLENRVTLNKDVKDKWGIPVPHIECTYGDNDRKLACDMLASISEMALEAGFTILTERSLPGPPGLCVHEVGTARMGNDPKTSVLNKFNQSWDIKNLFVTDGSCYVSSGVQNPTLTMMAITVRACDYIINQFKRGEL
jgi:choline dehydrogenase-like flavoprotein